MDLSISQSRKDRYSGLRLDCQCNKTVEHDSISVNIMLFKYVKNKQIKLRCHDGAL